MEHEFKVGDLVERLTDHGTHDITKPRGYTFVISEVNTGYVREVNANDYHSSRDIKLVKDNNGYLLELLKNKGII